MEGSREILITSALPYANGEIHLGHLLEYIQTDIWVRFQRLNNHKCYYICADDAHGTPIMLRAQQENISPDELITKTHASHIDDFTAFGIQFDNYYTTHSPENRQFSCEIFETLKNNGHIVEREIQQAYDEKAEMFLPDRFVRGQCPKCGADDQYGDCCEACGATYSPDELVNPISAISGSKPIQKASNHLFFSLQHFEKDIKEWLQSANVQQEIVNKIDEWFETGLKDWDISRDAPYFGFEIPGYTDKFFYVWLDAPIGYMASFKNLCDREGIDFNHFWNKESPTELHHFIGKDIAYFHTLFWPAMLKGAGFRLPSTVRCHGFVTINKQKMSKSRNTFITAKKYLEHLNPEYLRYYFSAHINGNIDDIDLNLQDFILRINSDLVGKFINIASRCAGFIRKHFDNEMRCDDALMNDELYCKSKNMAEQIAQCYETLDYSNAMRLIMKLADDANRYIEQKKPWDIAKRNNASEELHYVCSLSLLLFAQLVLYLKPVLPDSCNRCEQFLNIELQHWTENPFANKDTHTINQFSPIIIRVEQKQIDALTQSA